MFAIYDPVHLNTALGALVEAAADGDLAAVTKGLLWLYEESGADLHAETAPLLNGYRAEALTALGLSGRFD